MSDNEQNVRVALFREQKYDFITVFHLRDGQEDYAPSDYVRISEWMPVEFKPLSPAEVAGAQMVALSKLREKTVDEFKEKLDFIDGRIANLRALTGPEVQS